MSIIYIYYHYSLTTSIFNYITLSNTGHFSKIDSVILPLNIEKELKEYMGATPMIIIIKNKKVVYGSVGVIEENVLTQLASTYGV